MVSSVSTSVRAVVTPAADARVIYVSSTQGHDRNDGLTPAAPVRTLHRAESLVRDHSSDWVLLKRGDQWHEGLSTWNKRGRSPAEPLVIGGYGTGPRPLLWCGGDFAFDPDLDDISVIGLQFRANTRRRAAGTAVVRSEGARPQSSRAAACRPLPLAAKLEPDQPAPKRDHRNPQDLLNKLAWTFTRAAPPSAPLPIAPVPVVSQLPATSRTSAALPTLEPLAPLEQRLRPQRRSLRVKKVRFDGDRSITVTFNADVSTGLRAGDVLVKARDGQTIDPDLMELKWDAKRYAATWTFAGLPAKVLPSGEWRVTVRSYITDSSGRQLDGAGDGIGGEDHISTIRHVSRGPAHEPAPQVEHIQSFEYRTAA